MRQLYLVIGLLFSLIPLEGQNCSLTQLKDIPDNNKENSISLEVNTLSSGTATLCGVRLGLVHENVDELRFTLVSPSGKELVLTEGKTASSNTGNSSWDILFTRNHESADPDPVGESRWGDNVWEKDREYTGTYHPDGEEGLELFDGERTIGKWNLIYRDKVKGGQGSLRHFELIFCQAAACTECNVPNNFFPPSAELSDCGGAPSLQNIRPEVDLTKINSGFDYTFFLFNEENEVVRTGKQFDLTDLHAGEYRLQGVQYRPENQDQIGGIGEMKELNDLVSGNRAALCASKSSSVQNIKILSDPGPQEVIREVYGRDYIMVEGERIESDSLITQNLKNRYGCDSIVYLDVRFVEYSTEFIQDHRYGCTYTNIEIEVKNSMDFPVRRWYTHSGYISNESDPTSNKITVEASGKYFVVFKIEDYLDTVEYSLKSDENAPIFTMKNEYQMCLPTRLEIPIAEDFDHGSVFPAQSAAISGNMLTVRKPGLYQVTIEKNNCTASKNVLILPPSELPSVNIPDRSLSCDSQPVVFIPELTEDYENYTWFYEGEETGNKRNLTADRVGYYTFHAYNEGDCGVTGTTRLRDGTQNIDLRIQGPDKVDCTNKNQLLELRAAAGGSLATEWITPDHETVPGTVVPISKEGEYILQVRDEAGCNYTNSKTIVFDTTPVEISLPAYVEISCDRKAAEIPLSLTSSNGSLDISWKGASRGSNELTGTTEKTGEVSVTVTDKSSQCSATASTEVRRNPQKPFIVYDEKAGRTITCTESVKELEISVENCIGCRITAASDSDIVFSEEENKIIAREPGEITVTLNNGDCEYEETIRFQDGRAAVVPEVAKESVGCSGKPGKIGITNYDRYASIFFVRDNDTIRFQDQVRNFYDAETVNLIYTDKSNHCTDSLEIEISENQDAPVIGFEASRFLNCGAGEATLQLSGAGITRVQWTDESGQLLEDGPKKTYTTDVPGSYHFLAFNDNLCYTEGTIEVTDDRGDPSPDLRETYVLPCDRPEEGISIDYDTGSLAAASWLGPAGFNSTSFQPSLNLRGEYYLSLTGKNGCSSEFVLRLEEEKYSNPPDILASVTTCTSPSSRVHLQSYDDIKTVYWIDESGQSMEADTFEVFNPGRVKAIIENQSGCRATVSTDLEQDKEKVPFTINTPVVDCNDPAPEMYVILGEDADTGRPISYRWYQESVMISTRPVILVRDSMEFTAVVSYDNGCADSLSYFVKTDTIPPPFRLLPDTLNCKRSKIQLREEISIDGITEATWEGPEGFTSEDIRPIFTTPGRYKVSYSGKNGCVRKTSMEVFGDLTQPVVDSVALPSLGCNGKAVPLEYFSDDPIIEQYWIHADGNIVEDRIVEIDTAGDYILYLKSPNFCYQTDTFTIDRKILPDFELSVSDADCKDFTGGASVIPAEDHYSVRWMSTDTGQTDSTGLNSPPLPPGSYQVQITNPVNDCDTFGIFEVRNIGDLLDLEITIDDSLRCERNEANLISFLSIPSEHYIYDWHLNNRPVSISTDSIARNISEEGRYTLTVRDTLHDCEVTETYLNVRAGSTLKRFRMFISEPSCDIRYPGFAEVDSVIGAFDMDQILYSANGGRFVPEKIFPSIYANKEYTIAAKDQYGCLLDTTLLLRLRGVMEQVAPLRDTIINKGDTVNLNDPAFQIAYISEDAPMENSYVWTPAPDSYSCEAPCSGEVRVMIPETREVTAEVINEFGCSLRDTFTVFVREGDVLNFPNAIYPAGLNEENAHACVYTNQYIERIETMQITERNHSVIFQRTDFDPRHRLGYENCWDGTDGSGHLLPQGNYNWYIRYRTVYGAVREKYGTIFLLR